MRIAFLLFFFSSFLYAQRSKFSSSPYTTDTDEDGVFDIDDECRETYGDPDNSGCPWDDIDIARREKENLKASTLKVLSPVEILNKEIEELNSQIAKKNKTIDEFKAEKEMPAEERDQSIGSLEEGINELTKKLKADQQKLLIEQEIEKFEIEIKQKEDENLKCKDSQTCPNFNKNITDIKDLKEKISKDKERIIQIDNHATEKKDEKKNLVAKKNETVESEYAVKNGTKFTDCTEAQFIPALPPKITSRSNANIISGHNACFGSKKLNKKTDRDLIACLEKQEESCVAYLKCKVIHNNKVEFYIRPAICNPSYCDNNDFKDVDAQGCNDDLTRKFADEIVQNEENNKIKITEPAPPASGIVQ